MGFFSLLFLVVVLAWNRKGIITTGIAESTTARVSRACYTPPPPPRLHCSGRSTVATGSSSSWSWPDLYPSL
jgi:hypothetical protein